MSSPARTDSGEPRPGHGTRLQFIGEPFAIADLNRRATGSSGASTRPSMSHRRVIVVSPRPNSSQIIGVALPTSRRHWGRTEHRRHRCPHSDRRMGPARSRALTPRFGAVPGWPRISSTPPRWAGDARWSATLLGRDPHAMMRARARAAARGHCRRSVPDRCRTEAGRGRARAGVALRDMLAAVCPAPGGPAGASSGDCQLSHGLTERKTAFGSGVTIRHLYRGGPRAAPRSSKENRE